MRAWAIEWGSVLRSGGLATAAKENGVESQLDAPHRSDRVAQLRMTTSLNHSKRTANYRQHIRRVVMVADGPGGRG
jgi:hypothetical protein